MLGRGKWVECKFEVGNRHFGHHCETMDGVVFQCIIELDFLCALSASALVNISRRPRSLRLPIAVALPRFALDLPPHTLNRNDTGVVKLFGSRYGAYFPKRMQASGSVRC